MRMTTTTTSEWLEVRAWDGSSAYCPVDAAKLTGRTLWQDALQSRAPGKGINFYFRDKCISTVTDYKLLED